MADFPWKFDRDNDSNNTNLPTYNGPTLVVRGLQSKYVSDKRIPAVKRFFPNSEIVGIDAGHWLISEKPEEFRQGMFFLDLFDLLFVRAVNMIRDADLGTKKCSHC